jgi:hypothetical protein
MTDRVDVSGFAPVALEDVVAEASAMVRVDRKYLVHSDAVAELLAALQESFQALEIHGRRTTSYRSTYFDTADLHTCRAHLQQRRRRWKVRSRLYVEDALTRIEVKVRDGRGMTTKTVADTSPDRYGSLLGEDLEFVGSTLAGRGFEDEVDGLRPTMEVSYLRSTLADLRAGTRVTLDRGLVAQLGESRAWLDAGYVIVETKGTLRSGPADKKLLRLGFRPLSLSKYASTASLLRPELADNAVRRLHGVQLHTTPVAQRPRLDAGQVAS